MPREPIVRIECHLPTRCVIVEGQELERQARAVLDRNWHEHHTIPAVGLYPHQWLWDSAFVAIGLSYSNPERALREIGRLYDGQWSTGMVPHILFDPTVKSYWPDPAYWGVGRLMDAAPRGVGGSGITQPSVAPLAGLALLRNADGDLESVTGALRELFPKMVAFHRYLMTARDPERSGLISIVHPWESGLDNSPAWDAAMQRITPKDLPEYHRRDIDHVGDARERPSQETYDRYVHLCEQLKKVRYNDEAIYDTIDFLVKDPTSTVMLYLSNAALVEIARRIGEETGEIEDWMQRTREGLDRYLYDPEDGLYYAYDVRAGERLARRTVMSFLPVALDFVGREKADSLVEWLGHSNFCGDGCHCSSSAVPSSDVLSEDYAEVTYWRGPVWVNVNWVITQGMYRRGYNDRANKCFEALLALVWENGFWEFYSAHTGKGLGGRGFSWSAALAIDLLRSESFAHPAKKELPRT